MKKWLTNFIRNHNIGSYKMKTYYEYREIYNNINDENGGCMKFPSCISKLDAIRDDILNNKKMYRTFLPFFVIFITCIFIIPIDFNKIEYIILYLFSSIHLYFTISNIFLYKRNVKLHKKTDKLFYRECETIEETKFRLRKEKLQTLNK